MAVIETFIQGSLLVAVLGFLPGIWHAFYLSALLLNLLQAALLLSYIVIGTKRPDDVDAGGSDT